MNPCKKLIITDGNRTIFGNWDSDNIEVDLHLTDCVSTNVHFAKAIDFVGSRAISSEVTELRKKIRGGTKYTKPVYMLGGRVSVGEVIGDNSFGTNLALDYKYLFNPETDADRSKIIHNAYVESKKRLSHVTPIDRLIRSIVTPSKDVSTEFVDTSDPKEITNRFSDLSKIRKQICLLIGSVGSGKSTFVDYLKNKALSEDILSGTGWLNLNLNNAPVSRELVYDWCLDQLVARIKLENIEVDFDELRVIESIFHKEKLAFTKGLGKLLENDPQRYNIELFNVFQTAKNDSKNYLEALLHYFFELKGLLPIIILDNCDKRSRDEQLLMFEVANWLRDQFNCMIFLPIRETTYDIYRNEPPLDTVIKDLVFRIDPPLLDKVIQKRIDYALREMSSQQTDFYYYLTNGIRIECPRAEVANYLRSILHTLFQNRFFKKLMVGITGRNIRKGLEIFLDFCKSGYLSEDLILTMRTSLEPVEIPNYTVGTIMLRGQKRFYDERSARIKNVFNCEPNSDEIPDYFSRFHILKWLKERNRIHGPTRIKGYHVIDELIQELTLFGHTRSNLIRDVEFLMRNEYIISETQEYHYEPRNLVSITSAGFVLLELLFSVDYLATIAEDVYYRTLDEPKAIAHNIGSTGKSKHLNRVAIIENADTLMKYLIRYQKENWIKSEAFSSGITDPIGQQLVFSKDAIDRSKRKSKEYVDYDQLRLFYPPDTEIDAQVVNIQKYGIFFAFGIDAIGLVSTNNKNVLNTIDIGEWKTVRILSFNPTHKKFDLVLI
ncbi:MAG: hypothetical protein AB8F78_19395 [Saprospiraceae bacterium]